MSSNKRKREFNAAKSARCEEHIRKHEKCPYDCPRRTRCEHHAKQMLPCPPGCEIRQQELEFAKHERTDQAKKLKQLKSSLNSDTPTKQTQKYVASDSLPQPKQSSQPQSTTVLPPLSNIPIPIAAQSRVKGVFPFVEHFNSTEKQDEERKLPNVLVPIRLEITFGNIYLVDTFCWNLSGKMQFIKP
jgi:hypothetical protein